MTGAAALAASFSASAAATAAQAVECCDEGCDCCGPSCDCSEEELETEEEEFNNPILKQRGGGDYPRIRHTQQSTGEGDYRQISAGRLRRTTNKAAELEEEEDEEDDDEDDLKPVYGLDEVKKENPTPLELSLIHI